MNTKIIIAATVAALSLATTAFAQEGGRDTNVPSYNFSAAAPLRDTGSQGYEPGNDRVHAVFDNTTLPAVGSQGAVQTANSLPKGFEDGTVTFMQAQSVDRWFAQQADHRFALRHAALPNRG